MTPEFLNPGALVGMVAVAVPVLLHLISRRRARRHRFAAMEFILNSKRETARQVRLRQFLLLLTRILVVAFLAAALAQPVLKGQVDEQALESPIAVMFVIDTSGSMLAFDDGGNRRIDQAKTQLRDRLSKLPPDVRSGLLACGRRASISVAPSFDRSALFKALGETTAAPFAGQLAPCISEAAAALHAIEGEGDRRVVVLSDLAAHAFRARSPTTGQKISLEMVSLSDSDPPDNRGISSVNHRLSRGGLEVSFSVAGFGAAAATVPVDLFVDDQRVGRQHVSITPGQIVEGTFTHRLPADAETKTADQHLIELSLPDDALLEDNRFAYPVEPPRPVNIVVVDGDPQPVPFRDEIYYLENALRRPNTAASQVVVRTLTTDQLSGAALVDARLVVLANTPPLPNESVKPLIDFVKAGGGLLISAGDTIDTEWLNQTLDALLPMSIRGKKDFALLDSSQVREPVSLNGFTADHPIFDGWFDARTSAPIGLSQVEATSILLLEGKPGVTHGTVMRFSNGAPALVTRHVENGVVALLTTTIDRDWSDLSIRSGFVPLIHRLSAWLAGVRVIKRDRTIRAGEQRSLDIPSTITDVSIVLPNGSRANIESDVDNPGFRTTEQLGMHQVWGHQRDGKAEHHLRAEDFSVVFPRTEMDLTRASTDRISSRLPSGATIRSGGERPPVPIWPWALLSAVVLLMLEGLLLRRAR